MRLIAIAALLLSAVLAPAAFAQTPEHRGLWVGTADYDTPQEADALVARAVAAHLNALYALVWYNGGQAWYQSALSPLAKGVAVGFDPLGYLLQAAHAQKIEVHAWFVNGSVGWGDAVLTQHPDWELQTGRKTRPSWYDLGKPEVRQFETDVMLDCLRRYDVDGLHFDYIRYDSQQFCYCDYCQQEFARRSGLPPLTAGGKLFPAALIVSGNPLAEPTTAQVLAGFNDGVPAITLNKLGAGETALLNWNCLRTASPALEDTVKRLLLRFGATKDNVYQLRTSQTAAKYGSETQVSAAEWLSQLGYKPQVITETKLAEVPAGGIVFLYGQYYLSTETCDWLKQFVSTGGHALFGDGPVFAIATPALQEVLGMKTTGQYFTGIRIISPAPGQDFLQSGPALNLEQEKTRLEQWVAYRKWTVTELVRSVREGARKIKPQAKLSAAVFHNREAADQVCQDWYRWLQDGLVDYVLPMAYLMENAKLQAALEEYKAADPTLARIIPGLSLYQRKDGTASSRPRELVLSQIALSRAFGARGNLLFSSAHLNDDLTEALGQGPYRQPAPLYYPSARP